MKFTTYIKENIIVLDGATGTELMKEGFKSDRLKHMENHITDKRIAKLHKAYYDSGSNLVNTATFAINFMDLPREKTEDIIFQAIDNVKQAGLESDKEGHKQEKYIALNLGPMIRDFNRIREEDIVKKYSHVAQVGEKKGADVIFVETIMSVAMCDCMVKGIRQGSDLPVILTGSFDEAHKMVLGEGYEDLVGIANRHEVEMVGGNCSSGPRELAKTLEYMEKLTHIPMVFKPNLGIPIYKGDTAIYPEKASDLTEEIEGLINIGVRAFGGCCGTGAEHIRAVNHFLQNNGFIKI